MLVKRYKLSFVVGVMAWFTFFLVHALISLGVYEGNLLHTLAYAAVGIIAGAVNSVKN